MTDLECGLVTARAVLRGCRLEYSVLGQQTHAPIKHARCRVVPAEAAQRKPPATPEPESPYVLTYTPLSCHVRCELVVTTMSCIYTQPE